MDKKLNSFTEIFGRNPKGISREEFNKGMQRYFEKVKKEYPDPIQAHKKMQIDLNRAALEDFTDYPEVKDLQILKNQLLDYYPGLSKEQKEKIQAVYEEENKNRYGDAKAYTEAYRSGDAKFFPEIYLPKSKKDGKYIPEHKFAEPIEKQLKEQLSPSITIFQPEKDPSENLYALPHEMRHAFDLYTAPYRMYRGSDKNVQEQFNYPEKGETIPEELKLSEPRKGSFNWTPSSYKDLSREDQNKLKKDPSYRNVEWISQQEHIQPLYVSNPPISGYDEWLFNRLKNEEPTSQEIVESPELHKAFSKIKKTIKSK